ncbi:MAG: gamma-glutamyltransferase [Planctomycetaceae bacterium]|nr:gamma-glutamyltransferase [Planctomycetaceae bacterium]
MKTSPEFARSHGDSISVNRPTLLLCPSRLLVILIAALTVPFGSRHVAAQQFQNGVVAADHPAASEAGVRMLKQGGNVVDAAVATSFALSVVRPASCGIGGGGFMLIWDVESQSCIALDYRERAPAAASPEMYSRSESNFPEPESVRGARAAGIPGTVAGLCYAAERWGSLPLHKLLQPAIELCDQGVEIDDHDMEVQQSTLAKLKRFPGYEERFGQLKRLYLNGGQPWKKGDRFYSPQKAVLQAIASKGSQGFYDGDVADAILQAMTLDHGLITKSDLQSDIAAVRDPIEGRFHSDTVLTMPPPSSGGVALIQTLKTLQGWEDLHNRRLQSLGRNSPQYVHVVTEAMKHAFADRAEFLGDSDFAQVPVARLLSDRYAREQAQRIRDQSTLDSKDYGRFFSQPDGGTSHFSVMDSKGNAVACTETINLTFGSFVVVPQFGFILNNQMDDFAANPGKPNAFGLIQSEANSVQPRKKPLSSMTPTIVVRDGKAILACGASGGPRIISATIQTLLNHQLFGLSAQQAVAADRFHHQWFPNDLLLEDGRLVPMMKSYGHTVQQNRSLAAAQAASRKGGLVEGGSDPRKHGSPSGY